MELLTSGCSRSVVGKKWREWANLSPTTSYSEGIGNRPTETARHAALREAKTSVTRVGIQIVSI